MIKPDLRSSGDLLAWTAYATAIVAAVAVTIWLAWHVLLLAFFAILLAVLLRGVALRVARRTGLSDTMGLVAVVLVILLGAAGTGYWAGHSLVEQGQQFTTKFRQQAHTLEDRYGSTPIGKFVTDHVPKAAPSGAGGAAFGFLGSLGGLLSDVVVLLISALYFASSPRPYVNGFVRLLPVAYRPRGRQILEQSGRTLWLWLVGQGVDMLVVGVLAGVGFAVVGVPLPILLGLITGLFTFIPYLGPLVSAVPAVLLGFSVSGRVGLGAIGVMLVCHLVEGYAVAPLVQRRLVDLPPALTILSLVLFGTLFGPLGAVLGTPLAAVLLVVVQQAYVADILGDRAPAGAD